MKKSLSPLLLILLLFLSACELKNRWCFKKYAEKKQVEF